MLNGDIFSEQTTFIDSPQIPGADINKISGHWQGELPISGGGIADDQSPESFGYASSDGDP